VFSVATPLAVVRFTIANYDAAQTYTLCRVTVRLWRALATR